MMNQLAARELINTGWLTTCACLVVIFIAFLVKEMQYDGWYPKIRNQAAIALLIYFCGETLARAWGALLLYKMTHAGQDLVTIFAVEERFPIAMIGAGISFFGALCCVRVFSPASWGHKAWLGVAIIAGLLMWATYYF